MAMQIANVPVKVGLALGSGAARGIAHIGVLEVFEEAGIPIHMVAGSSMGSVIGAMYASGIGVPALKEMIEDVGKDGGRFLMDFTFPRWGLIQGRKLESFLAFKLGNARIEDTRIPLAVAACCLEEGRVVHFKKGSLVKAVRASSSMPGVFEPVQIEDKTYVDGGVLDRVPVEILRKMGADVIIGVDVGYRGGGHPSPKNIYSVLSQFYSLMEWSAMEHTMEHADCILTPPVQGFDAAAFASGQDIYRRGRLEALAHLDEIRQLMAVMGVKLTPGHGGLHWLGAEQASL